MTKGVSTAMVKELRDKTGVGVMECKRALEEADGDMEQAVQLLRQRRWAMAEKKASRQVSQGLIEAYLHAGGRVGAMVEVNCETDFVARTAEFKALAHELAMQVAAMGPQYISPEELPPDAPLDPQQVCLLLQPYIRDQGKTIGDLIMETIAKVGENIRVRRFARFELGS